MKNCTAFHVHAVWLKVKLNLDIHVFHVRDSLTYLLLWAKSDQIGQISQGKQVNYRVTFSFLKNDYRSRKPSFPSLFLPLLFPSH